MRRDHADLFRAYRGGAGGLYPGAGHIGFAVAKIAAIAGFKVAVVDDRPAYASKERFPDAGELHVGAPEEIVPSLKLNKVSYVVIACRGHLEDQRTLARALKTPGLLYRHDRQQEKSENHF